ncbi:CoA transferase [Myxococcota bacterium]|nr:CoA transferase [Myxococcota bacterium]
MSELSPPDAAPLAGVRVIECTLLAPSGLGMHLADLGAEVIKVEAPGRGDYVREVGQAKIDGISLLHWHMNRGKRSLALDLRKSEGVEVFRQLVSGADVVVEGMRPGALERRGLGWEQLQKLNPALVFCSLSGYGMTGPYRDLASHGVAYDAFAGTAPPAIDDEGFTYIPDSAGVGMHVGALYGALGVVSCVIRARSTGQGCVLDVAQNDAAAAFSWSSIEGARAHPAKGEGDGGSSSDPSGMYAAVRYQYYQSLDGHVLFMASERKFWKNFARGVERIDLYEKWPGEEVGDHARGNLALRRELREIFSSRNTRDWIAFGLEHDVPITPVHDARSVTGDPQFQDRFRWFPRETHGADLMSTPIHVVGETLPTPVGAPVEVGRDSEMILRDVLGYDDDRIEALRSSGVLGS